MRVSVFALTFLFACSLLSCDKGLEPPPPTPTISGTIYFSGVRPSCDSVRLLAVVLIEAAPPYVPEALVNGLLDNSVLPFLLAPCTFRDTTYTFKVVPNKRYNYLGVAQNYDTNLYSDWRVVGFSHLENDSARTFELLPGESLTNVDIDVRFDSLPRQPFVK